MGKVCKWYSQEGCLSRNKDDEPKEDDCPEEFEETCIWSILSDDDYDYNEE